MRRPCGDSKFSHAAGEFGCLSLTRCVSVQYLLNRYKDWRVRHEL